MLKVWHWIVEIVAWLVHLIDEGVAALGRDE